MPWLEITSAQMILYVHQGLGRAVGGSVHLQPRKSIVSLGCLQSSVASRTLLLWSGETSPGVLCSGNGFRLEGSRLRLNTRKKFLTVRMMRLQNQSPRVVNSPPL